MGKGLLHCLLMKRFSAHLMRFLPWNSEFRGTLITCINKPNLITPPIWWIPSGVSQRHSWFPWKETVLLLECISLFISPMGLGACPEGFLILVSLLRLSSLLCVWVRKEPGWRFPDPAGFYMVTWWSRQPFVFSSFCDIFISALSVRC